MNKAETTFMTLVDKLTESDPDIFPGKMMNSPALKFKDKVFAFYNKGEMGFRFRPQFNPDKIGLINAKPLKPFETKPPLKGWYLVEKHESNLLHTLAAIALAFTRTL